MNQLLPIESTETRKDGVIFVQKTAKVHMGAIINKLQAGLSVSNVNKDERRPSLDSSQSSKISETNSTFFVERDPNSSTTVVDVEKDKKNDKNKIIRRQSLK